MPSQKLRNILWWINNSNHCFRAYGQGCSAQDGHSNSEKNPEVKHLMLSVNEPAEDGAENTRSLDYRGDY